MPPMPAARVTAAPSCRSSSNRSGVKQYRKARRKPGFFFACEAAVAPASGLCLSYFVGTTSVATATPQDQAPTIITLSPDFAFLGQGAGCRIVLAPLTTSPKKVLPSGRYFAVHHWREGRVKRMVVRSLPERKLTKKFNLMHYSTNGACPRLNGFATLRSACRKDAKQGTT